jgi:hypothetical protein
MSEITDSSYPVVVQNKSKHETAEESNDIHEDTYIYTHVLMPLITLA